MRLLALAVLLCLMSAGAFGAPLPRLTHTLQVHQLTAEQAAEGYPVRIRGVITNDAPAPDFIIQDESGGIYVEGLPSQPFPHHLGDFVELEGVSGPGKFAPVILERSVRVLGQRPLPKARLYQFEEISSGQRDSQWTRIRGVVRAATIDHTSWRELTLALHVASGNGEFNVRVPIPEAQDFSSWVDREVLIEGVCGTLFTANRQMKGLIFYVPRLSFVKLVAPAQTVPEVEIASLMRFSPTVGVHRYVRIRGVVSGQQPGSAIFLQNGDRGVRVLTQQDTPVAPGDELEVLGFPAIGESAPILEDAVYQKVGHIEPPAPAQLDLAQPWESYEGRLVATDARLLQREQLQDGVQLLLQRESLVFSATLHGDAEQTKALASIPVNSVIRLQGVCLVRAGGLWAAPQTFLFLLRSADDIAVLSRPSWWNLNHVMWVLALALGALFAAAAWVVVLNRRLKEQTALIQDKVRSSAVLQERNRIAREIHDTLEQELAAITMQLDLAMDCFEQAPSVAQNAVVAAREMSRHSMVDARRSIWDLRCHLLEQGDLVSALRQIVEPLARSGGAQLKFEVRGEPLRLEPHVEMNLLRIAQEAVANAVKHGRAHTVQVLLCFEAASVSLTVSDDGCGFAIGTPAAVGHFGLLDMRERAETMGAVLEVTSEPGKGTCISIQINLQPTQEQALIEADTHSRS